jgi:hypothetical protein
MPGSPGSDRASLSANPEDRLRQPAGFNQPWWLGSSTSRAS